MPSPNISFAKIVATPTVTSWSQAYNAGSLFLAVSLSISEETDVTLAEEGKKLLNHIEAEFFGLEEKNLTTIEATLNQLVATIPETLNLSLSLGYVKENILYCFLKGMGEILLKRGDSRAPLLKGIEQDEIISASGHLKTDDLILLETAQFARLIKDATLKEAFEYPIPNDIAETITPHVHNSKEGGASAIILAFKGIPQPVPTEEPEPSEEQISLKKAPNEAEDHRSPHPVVTPPPPPPHHVPTHAIGDEDVHTSPSFIATLFTRVKKVLPTINLSKQQKIIAAIACLLVLVLIGGIVTTKQNQMSQEQTALFEEVYPQALEAYEEGENLFSLNEALAREDFLKARELLSQLEGKFPEGSDEAKQIAALQEKIDARIGSGESGTSLTATKVDASEAPVLAALLENQSAVAGVGTEDGQFVLTPDGILSFPDEETIVENEDTWTNPVGLGAFGTNFYILDTTEGLLKLVPTEDGYVASSYFTENEPDLSESTSLAIDGSVYILMKDGTIGKYTRGEKESFSVSSDEVAFQKPTHLITSSDMENLYLLDNGTGQVVKIGKDASLQRVYQADVLRNARAISISDDETTLFVLQGESVYSLPLN